MTVTGVDDTIYDGDVPYTIVTGPASSSDAGYDGLDAADVSATNQDNESQPTISISDVSKKEGNSGTTAFVFTVTLSHASYQTVTVNYATADGTAKAGTDYTAVSGTLTFAPYETSKDIIVSVNGDTIKESNEAFYVDLSGVSNATIADGHAVATILNDDNGKK